jgi:hypothetical protein
VDLDSFLADSPLSGEEAVLLACEVTESARSYMQGDSSHEGARQQDTLKPVVNQNEPNFNESAISQMLFHNIKDS